jgi:predicted ATPase
MSARACVWEFPSLLSRLKVIAFKSLQDIDIALPKLVVLFGPNGRDS